MNNEIKKCLNEKSAEYMGWTLQKAGGFMSEYISEYIDENGKHMYFHHEGSVFDDLEVWYPEGNHNQAIMFYKKARSINPQKTRDSISEAIYELSKTMNELPCELDLTPAQITKACLKTFEEM